MTNPMERQKCRGHSRSGKPCKNWAIEGGTVCRFHGGAAPQVKAKAQARVEQWRISIQVGKALDEMGVEHEDPMKGLLEEVARSASLLRIYQMLVRELETAPAGNAPTLFGPNHLGDSAPHVVVEMFNGERDRHAKLCKMAIDAGLEERAVQLAEQEANLIVQVIVRVLEDPTLGLSVEQRTAGKQVAARHLRAVS